MQVDNDKLTPGPHWPAIGTAANPLTDNCNTHLVGDL